MVDLGLASWERAGIVGVFLFIVVGTCLMFIIILRQQARQRSDEIARSDDRFDRLITRVTHTREALDDMVQNVSEMHRTGVHVAQESIRALNSLETRMGQEFLGMSREIERRHESVARHLSRIHERLDGKIDGRMDEEPVDDDRRAANA